MTRIRISQLQHILKRYYHIVSVYKVKEQCVLIELINNSSLQSIIINVDTSKYKIIFDHRIITYDIVEIPYKNDETSSKKINDMTECITKLRKCIENTRYKIYVKYGRFVFYITKNNKIRCFVHVSEMNTKSFDITVAVDLDYILTHTNSIQDDSIKIMSEIQNTLNNCHNYLISGLQIISGNIGKLKSFDTILHERKIKMIQQLQKIDSLYTETIHSERMIRNNISKIEIHTNGNASIKRIHNDVENGRKLHILKTKLDNIVNVKQDIVSQYNKINSNYSRLMFITDKVYSDNLVLIEKIQNNLKILYDL